MSGYNRAQGSRSVSGKSDSRKHTNAGFRSEWIPKPPKISEPSVTEESVVKDVSSNVNDLKLTSTSLDDDGSSNKVKKHIGDKSQAEDDDDNGKLKHSVFDICLKSGGSAIKLKAGIHVANKEKRNQNKQSMEGPNITILKPGMVLLKGYISLVDQINMVKTCRELGINNGGFYQPSYSSGSKMHLRMMCLGKNWDPESNTYTELRSFDQSKPPGIPEKFHDLVIKALKDSNEFIKGKTGGKSADRKVIPSMSPDICIVNFYTKNGKLGLHQDKDESEISLKKGLPVVSFSIGDSCDFLYGETRSIDEANDVKLESGDVLIFGGKSRSIFHGVTTIHPNTTPTLLKEATDMLPGRLNLTFRMY